MTRRIQVAVGALFFLASVAYGIGIVVGYLIGAF